ncbi:hypothetical protein DMENIID0001_163580 [Sergentomyia squamirostris]
MKFLWTLLLITLLQTPLSSAASVGRSTGKSKSTGRIFGGVVQSLVDAVPWLPIDISVSDTVSSIGSAWSYMTSSLGSLMSNSGESKPRKRKKAKKKKAILPKIKNDKEMGIRPDPFPGQEPHYFIPMFVRRKK